MYFSNSELGSLIAPTLRILEKDYEQTFKQKVNIVYDKYTDTSYNDMSGTIHIGGKMLREMENENKNQAFCVANIYTLAEHEVGHSRFTGTQILNVLYQRYDCCVSEVRDILNILEDARMENLVSALNVVANFKLVRYVFQDKLLKELSEEDLINPTTMCLALFRTIKPERYYKFYNQLFGKGKVSELKRLFNRYFLYSKDIVNNAANATEIISIYSDFYDYLKEMFSDYENQNQEQQQQQSGGCSCSQQSGEQEQESEQSEEQEQENQETGGQEQESQETENNGNSNSGETEKFENQGQDAPEQAKASNGSGNVDNKNSTPKLEKSEQSDFEKELEKLIDEQTKKAEKQLKEFSEEPIHICPIKSTNSDYKPNMKININLEHIAWNGKKNAEGLSTKQAYLSSPRNLNKSRYREYQTFKQGFPKLYDIQTEAKGFKTNKKPTVSFYIDLSGSMHRELGRTERYICVLDYVKTFCDKMSKYMDINIYSFGEDTFRLNKNYLSSGDFYQIMYEYGGSTYLSLDKDYKNSDLNIVLTDGIIDNFNWGVPKDFKNSAMFIILKFQHKAFSDYSQYDCIPEKHIEYVDTEEKLIRAYEKATSKIAELLRA